MTNDELSRLPAPIANAIRKMREQQPAAEPAPSIEPSRGVAGVDPDGEWDTVEEQSKKSKRKALRDVRAGEKGKPQTHRSGEVA
jgi:hypothetical protein